MNFRPELAAAVMDGTKRVTRRAVSENPNSPYHPRRAKRMVGKRIAVCPGRGKRRIGRVRVAAVELDYGFSPELRRPTLREARLEGFDSVDAFVAKWVELNGHGGRDVWRIRLADPEPGA